MKSAAQSFGYSSFDRQTGVITMGDLPDSDTYYEPSSYGFEDTSSYFIEDYIAPPDIGYEPVEFRRGGIDGMTSSSGVHFDIDIPKQWPILFPTDLTDQVYINSHVLVRARCACGRVFCRPSDFSDCVHRIGDRPVPMQHHHVDRPMRCRCGRFYGIPRVKYAGSVWEFIRGVGYRLTHSLYPTVHQ